jgi:activator of HSP90 ATPase
MTITQTVEFKNTGPATLYELYMNAKKHSESTGAPATITPKEGAPFTAHGDYISGKNLTLVKDQLIVQTWRASDWDPSVSDSIFMIHLASNGKNVTLRMVHANLPDDQADSINTGWETYYWEPWRKYLAAKEK